MFLQKYFQNIVSHEEDFVITLKSQDKNKPGIKSLFYEGLMGEDLKNIWIAKLLLIHNKWIKLSFYFFVLNIPFVSTKKIIDLYVHQIFKKSFFPFRFG